MVEQAYQSERELMREHRWVSVHTISCMRGLNTPASLGSQDWMNRHADIYSIVASILINQAVSISLEYSLVRLNDMETSDRGAG